MPIRTLLLIFLLCTQSCAAAQDSDVSTVELRGVYIFGHATSTLEPCASGQPMWLDGNSKGAEDLGAAYESSMRGDLEPLFVVVRGELDADWDIGDYYVGRFVIEELIEFSADADVIENCLAPASSQ